jgi:hypothetical protein
VLKFVVLLGGLSEPRITLSMTHSVGVLAVWQQCWATALRRVNARLLATQSSERPEATPNGLFAAQEEPSFLPCGPLC